MKCLCDELRVKSSHKNGVAISLPHRMATEILYWSGTDYGDATSLPCRMAMTILYWSGTEFVRFCVHLVLSVLTIKLPVLEGARCEN